MRKHLFTNVAVVGVGLLGGSLVEAIYKRKIAKNIYGICRSKKSAALIKKSKLHCKILTKNDPKILRNIDCVIIATNVRTIPRVVESIAPHLKKGAIVIDVGSTKAEIEAEINKIVSNKIFYVGCHPMAGSEHQGPQYSNSDLFKNALCFILKNSAKTAKLKIASFWKAVGSQVCYVSAKDHDQIVARVSHLPHIASTALLLAVSRKSPRGELKYGGKGLQDMIRVAGANPSMWLDIFTTNKKAIQKEIRAYINQLISFEKALKNKKTDDVVKLLKKSKVFKQQSVRLSNRSNT